LIIQDSDEEEDLSGNINEDEGALSIERSTIAKVVNYSILLSNDMKQIA
jgi:hypothetical protein